MRVFVDAGHGASPDTGAEGLLKEEAVVNAVSAELVAILRAKSITVEVSKVTSPSSVKNSLEQRANQAKAFKADVFISIHANKGGGTGVEVYGNSDSGAKTATKIEKAIAGLGFNSRGQKKASFYVLNKSIDNAVLVELFFLDSAVDVAKYTALGPNKMAAAIASAVLDTKVTGPSVSASLTETETFICRIKEFCSKNEYNATAFLAVRLFETGGSLAAGYVAQDPPGRDYPAFGLLQWTPAGCEPVQKHVGISEAHTKANNIAAYNKIKGKSRLEQLDLCFKYFDYWLPLIQKKFPQFDKGGIEYQYVVTLSPGAGNNYKDGNGVTASQLINKPRFKALLSQAEGMLNGTVPVPNDDGKVHVGYSANAAHVKKMGSVLVNPSVCSTGISSQEPGSAGIAAPNSNSKGVKSLEDLLPMSLSFSIPEYPRLVGLKPGDVLILPASATYRDWVVTSVNRTFNQGLNKLAVQANRAISPKPFVQTELLSQEYKTSDNVSKYYWLS